MRRILLVFFTCLLLLPGLFAPSQAAQAQSTVVIDRLEINLWPEYDRTSVLVIYRISLPATTALPAELSVRIPREAGQPYNVAMQNVEGLYSLKYNTVISGDWLLVSFTTPSPNIQIEYYDPRLVKDEEDRFFVYSWPGDYAVRNLSVVIQQPFNATGMSIQPDMGEGSEGSDGLVYYDLIIGEVQADTTFTIGMSYQKPDNSLSVNLQPVQPVEAIGEQTTGRVRFMEMLPFAMGILGLLLIITGIIWYWQSEKKIPALAGRKDLFNRSKNAPSSDGQPPVYCHQCGRRALTGDLFCRTCGTKLRYE